MSAVYTQALWLFENVLRDKDGEKFTDIRTTDDIKSNVIAGVLTDLLNEVYQTIGIMARKDDSEAESD